MGTTKTIKVFIASPGDLAEERRAFKEVIDGLNKGFGRGADVVFEPLGWEDALSQVGRRSQAVINQDIDACDVFILVMWRRWGQEAPDANPYSSYTEEEFYRALARREKKNADGLVRPAVCVFFKHIDPSYMTDPGPQLAKVLAFRRKLEDTKAVLYHPFDDVAAFRTEIEEHLIGFAQGRLDTDDGVGTPIVPEAVLAEIEKHKEEKQKAVAELAVMKAEKEQLLKDAEQARADAKTAAERAEAAEQLAEAKAAKKSVELAEKAAKAAREGKLEEARQDFAKALDGTTNIDVLYLGYEFFQRIGEFDEAERLLRRWLSISGPDQESANTADAYGNLGNIERRRGNLDGAEMLHKKALAIDEKLGNQRGMAEDYGNLGVIEDQRGNLDAAETFYKKALAIDEKLGNRRGIATRNGNLGLIETDRGRLEAAEEYLKKALSIDEKLGNQEGVARHYHNLGEIECLREKLDAAEDYYTKALAINEKIGDQEGMAFNWWGLGRVARERGRTDEARVLLTRARDTFRKIGAKDRERDVQAFIDKLK